MAVGSDKPETRTCETARPQIANGRKVRSHEATLVMIFGRGRHSWVGWESIATRYHRADVVADGRGALCALAEKDYDLVLMDCQLPEMDGYEATRRIRQPDTAVRNHDIPIIATTAHALAGDRERCMDAGMNGYVSKPLRHEALEQAIEHWTGGTLAPMAPAAAPEPTRSAPAVAFDGEDFVERLMGNEDLARRLVRGFVDDMPQQIARLAQAVNSLDSHAGAPL